MIKVCKIIDWDEDLGEETVMDAELYLKAEYVESFCIKRYKSRTIVTVCMDSSKVWRCVFEDESQLNAFITELL